MPFTLTQFGPLVYRILLAIVMVCPLHPAELFENPVVVRAKNFTIRESDVAEAYIGHKAAAAATGKRPPAAIEQSMKEQILDRMIATKLLLARATPQDREQGRQTAEEIIAKSKQKAETESAYRRRLYAVGSSPEKFEAEMLEQAIVQAVIDRELRSKQVISEIEIKKFYDENPSSFKEPEKARVAHILFATRKIPSGQPLPLEQRLAKKAAAEKAVARARAGEDFAKLVGELSDDPETRQKGGELGFIRGSGTVPPQFESAALSLQLNQVSDPVLSVFGYHVIKLLEKTPARQVPLERVSENIRLGLQREAVQKALPGFIAQLRKEAEVQVVAPVH